MSTDLFEVKTFEIVIIVVRNIHSLQKKKYIFNILKQNIATILKVLTSKIQVHSETVFSYNKSIE